jgi:hypothetical protein
MVMVNRHGNPVFTQLSDKYLVRDYVREKVGERFLVNLLWHGLDPRDIPFDNLPPKCVLKTNHSSGINLIFKEGVDHSKVVEKLQRRLNENHYWVAREFHYYRIQPRLLIEEFLDDGAASGPLDYRFWCFEGRPEVIQVDNHAHSINPFYDSSWNKLSLSYRDQFEECDICRPFSLDEMIRVASALAAGFDFVRVDLYNVHQRVYFGELTFTPVAGKLKLRPDSWDVELGRKWRMI